MNRAVFVVLAPIVVIAGCHRSSALAPKSVDPVKAAFRKEIPQATGTQLATVSNGANQFSLNLLRQIVKEQPNDNVVLYPLGLVQNLTLIHETAQGKSREIIENLLGVKGTTGNVLASFHSTFLNDLESDPYEAMRIANSVWISDGFKPKEEAVKRLDALFGCSVQSFSSNLDKAKQDMNAWVSKNTEGEIKEIQTQLSGDTTLVLLNALIFNGQWLHEFDPSKTEPSEFTTPTQTISVPMMFAKELRCRSSRLGNSPNTELSFLGGLYSFVVIVPEDAKTFKQTVSKMDAQTFAKFIRSMHDTELNIFLPRLELSSKLSLLEVVKSVGGKSLNEGGVDALNLAPNTEGLSVSSIYSQAILKLDEKGVRVKAMVETAEKTAEFMEVRCDRPFLYFIIHKPSGTIVVCGVVNDPTKN